MRITDLGIIRGWESRGKLEEALINLSGGSYCQTGAAAGVRYLTSAA